MKLAAILVLLAQPVVADCLADEEVFVTCQIADSTKTLSVCFDANAATYRFGQSGQVPELTISATIADVDYEPWNGSGTAIWERVRFYNLNYVYTVLGGYDRPWGDEAYEDVADRNFGGVQVSRDGVLVADLACERSTVEYAWGEGLEKSKADLGYIWDDRALEWVALPD